MSTPINNSESREFRLHKDILWSIIRSQAGSIGKAVLELVMNSIDAGATGIHITLSNTHIKVVDDGKGFSTRTEIEDFFETFGTPHQEGDARYGRFRMGRGQIMAFSRNKWQSGIFEMMVDIRDRGLNYDLHTKKKSLVGCTIHAELYDALSPSEMLRLGDEITELCKYAPIPVFLNKQRVSLELDKEKWSHQDDDAYYLYRAGSRSLEVYNLGVLVRAYYSSEYGTGGVIVSKKQLNVNFARNDILVSQCPVWKRISGVIRQYVRSIEDKAPVQDEAWRSNMYTRVLSGNFDNADAYLEALDKYKIFTDISGRHLSLSGVYENMVKRAGSLVAEKDFDFRADRVHQGEIALVLSPKTLERGQWKSFSDSLDRIIVNLTSLSSYKLSSWTIQAYVQKLEVLKASIKSLNDVAKSIKDEHNLVEEKKLSKDEKVVLLTLKRMSYYMARALSLNLRDIKICSSTTLDGYTDGSSFIAIERKFLKISGMAGKLYGCFDRLKYLLLHEYCHECDDSTGHGHPAEFDQKFRQALECCDFESYWSLAGWTHAAVGVWLSARRKAGLKLSSTCLTMLDELSVVVDEASSTSELKKAA